MSEPQRELVRIGQFGSAHGIDGELRLFAGDLGSPVFAPGSRLYAESREGVEPLVLEGLRPTPEYGIAAFESIDGRGAAERYVNRDVYVEAADLPEPGEGDFFQYELEACDVRLAGRSDESSVGEVGGFFSTGANDVMVVVTSDGREVFVPMIEDAVEELAPDEGYVRLAAPAVWAPDGEDPFESEGG